MYYNGLHFEAEVQEIKTRPICKGGVEIRVGISSQCEMNRKIKRSGESVTVLSLFGNWIRIY